MSIVIGAVFGFVEAAGFGVVVDFVAGIAVVGFVVVLDPHHRIVQRMERRLNL